MYLCGTQGQKFDNIIREYLNLGHVETQNGIHVELFYLISQFVCAPPIWPLAEAFFLEKMKRLATEQHATLIYCLRA
jgi:hypothetical protein